MDSGRDYDTVGQIRLTAFRTPPHELRHIRIHVKLPALGLVHEKKYRVQSPVQDFPAPGLSPNLSRVNSI
jgi:hypothetical protein